MNITSRGGTDVPDVKYPWMGTIWVKQSKYSALISNKKSNYNKLIEKYELLENKYINSMFFTNLDFQKNR